MVKLRYEFKFDSVHMSLIIGKFLNLVQNTFDIEWAVISLKPLLTKLMKVLHISQRYNQLFALKFHALDIIYQSNDGNIVIQNFLDFLIVFNASTLA